MELDGEADGAGDTDVMHALRGNHDLAAGRDAEFGVVAEAEPEGTRPHDEPTPDTGCDPVRSGV